MKRGEGGGGGVIAFWEESSIEFLNVIFITQTRFAWFATFTKSGLLVKFKREQCSEMIYNKRLCKI